MLYNYSTTNKFTPKSLLENNDGWIGEASSVAESSPGQLFADPDRSPIQCRSPGPGRPICRRSMLDGAKKNLGAGSRRAAPACAALYGGGYQQPWARAVG
ncbi:hypothetical protein SETIT_6G195200v2 [Setaria italica]|uniref:Uncharacterized protein n=2 Tax=Setaria TaxID=4554 RepID=A0A368RNB5_SETIT|nr:hypothetical protein SETIT_6G195200v2 [Setaria italica]TKW10951.1 hypothetical protein SEVIR_6G202500v2 [Setaria viridis]